MHTMILYRWLVIVACAGMLVPGCGKRPESLTLTSDTQAIAADGMTVVELSAKVIFRSDPIQDGKRVKFVCSQPLLFELPEDVDATHAKGRKLGETEVETEASGGVARAFLQAPLVGGDVTITASFTTINKDVLTDTLTLTIGDPPLISGGEGNGDPTSILERFGLSCDHVNIGAFVQDRDTIEVGCNLVLQNQAGVDLLHTPVDFYVEAGEMLDSPATDRNPRTFTYVVPLAPVIKPRDVRPFPIEQSEALVGFGEGLISGAVEQNPRDGLVTILAVIRGHEGFEDENGNGTRDDGEAFIDEGEPFLDIDDDGVHTAIDPAHCCDTNGNGVVDGPNGRWDSDVWLGRMTHILWTGEVDIDRSFLTPPVANIAALQDAQFTLFFVDGNFNPVASNDASDEVEVLPLTSRIRVTPLDLETGRLLSGTTGMILRTSFPMYRFGLWDATTNPVFFNLDIRSAVLFGREWEFTLHDDRSKSQICNGLAEIWEVRATVRYTIARGVSRSTGLKTASGTFDDLPDTDVYCQ